MDCGRYPAKASVGDQVPVSADVFRDGHEVLRAVVRFRAPGQRGWSEAPLSPYDAHIGGNGFRGSFPVDAQGLWTFSFEAWADEFASWRSEITRKRDAGEPDLSSELLEGRALVEATAGRAKGADRDRLEAALEAWGLEEALSVGVSEAAARWPDRSAGTRTKSLELDVDRVRARYGAWYELPPLLGRARGDREGRAAAGRARLRRPLPAAHPPHRGEEPQGAQQRHRRRARRSRLPLGHRLPGRGP